MQRTLLGIIAAGCLLGAAAMWIMYAAAEASFYTAGFLLRMGLILGAIWLALPQAARIIQVTSGPMLWLIIGGIVVVALRPALLLYVLVALIAGWFLAGRIKPLALLGKFAAPKRRARRSTTIEGKTAPPSKPEGSA